MQSFNQQMRRVGLAVVALSLVGLAPSAYAAGTDTNFDTNIVNRASVNYSVSGVPQTVIESSPTGNSTPGVGAGDNTSFRVDKRLMFVAEETNGAATVSSPGLTNVVTVFRVTNTSNGPQDFGLSADNLNPLANLFGRADAPGWDMANFRTRVSGAACSTATMTTPTYAGETQAYIEQLGEDACAYVFVLADTPAAAANATASTIRLVVRPSVDAANGGDWVADTGFEAETGLADDPDAVEVVFAETGTNDGNSANDGVSFAYDQYFVGTLTVTKTAAVISDGFSPAGQAKAIPGAVVEYTITVQNNGLATSGASLLEAIPANTTYVAGSTTLNGAPVSDVGGVMPYVSGAPINSPAAAAGVINPGSTAAEIAVVTFRVTIN
jgi:uncharacterized repeat protein (TIGR01451 family)